MKKMRIELPGQVKEILDILAQNGYEGYAVGGCVRDAILNRTPSDWDITTSARPWQVKKLFSRTVDTGLKHGTVTVLMGGKGYEVTTYRVDGEYEDHRRPKDVRFTARLEDDLQRRDFTINAMAYNEQCGLVDVFGGIEDLERGLIRCVGNPRERFSEDALRILRAVRFSAQLGFEVDRQTGEAVREFAPSLSAISAERIQTELVKMMVSPHPEYLEYAWKLGITAVILPEFDRAMETTQNNPHHCYSVGRHTLEALKHIEPERCLRLAVLFHDLGKPQVRTADERGIDHFHGHAAVSGEMAAQIMRRLKFDNETQDRVKMYVLYHDIRPELNLVSVRRAVSRIGVDAFKNILKIKMADTLAQSPKWQPEKKEYLGRLQELFEEICESGDCLTVKGLAVSGRDLLEDGMEQGKDLGEMLSRLLSWVLEHPQDNNREFLLDYSRKLRARQ